MILNKNEIKFIKAFLIETAMTRIELAKEAGIGLRTLYNALHEKAIKERTYEKIVSVMISETLQRKLICADITRKKKDMFLLKTKLKPVIYILVITAFVLLMNWLVK